MNDARPPKDTPRLHNPDDDFVPLRLQLQPGGLSVEMTRPDMLLGRHSEADVRLALPDVSRRHCRFVFTDGGWQVLELNSLNGVFVNDERLDVSTLRHGDRLRIASLTFAVELGHLAPDEDVLRSIAGALPERRKAS